MTMDTMMQIGDFVANANVRTVRRLLRALVEGNQVGGDAFVSPDFLDHDAPGADNSPPRRGSVQFRESVQWIHRVFADLEFEEREVIAVDDRVVVRGVMRGRHTGRLLGIAPTGRRVEVHQVHVFRLTGNKVVEHRAVWGEFHLLLQLGAVLC